MIIFLIIPTLKQGGAERVMSELANEFVNYPGVTVHLVLLAKSKDFYPLDTGIEVHRLGFKNTGPFGKVKSEIATFVKLRSLLKKYRPVAVLSFMEKYNIFTLLAGALLGLKIFVSDRSNPRKKPPFMINMLRKLTYRTATGVVAQTSLAKELLWNQTKNKNIQVISNPVRNVNLFPAVTRERIILNVGRLVPEKGQKYLLEAFSKLDAPKWKLAILGDGPMLPLLKRQAKELGIADRLIMPGSVANVDEWLARSSVFVLPSVSEGFPNALVEAMAAGLPCISFDCDAGPRDIIENGANGFLIEQGNVVELLCKLNMLINDECLSDALGENALAVRNKYHIKLIGHAYIDFFRGQWD